MSKLLQMPLLFADLEEPLTSAGRRAGETSSPTTDPTPDAPQRTQALDIHRSWIVEAPAGSGKTGLLIQRFLKLLAHGGVDRPDEVLAITFTRKADAEMRRRVLDQLTAAAQNQPLPPTATPFDHDTRQLAAAVLHRDRTLNWQILNNPQQLNIRTIDSLCAELAGSQSVLTGSAIRYAPTTDADPLYEAAAQRTLLHMGGPDPILTADLESLLLHRDANPGDFTRLLAGMLRGREQWGELVPLDPDLLTEAAFDEQVRPRIDRTLNRLLAQELQTTANLIGDDLLHQLSSLAHTLSACPGYNAEPHVLAACLHTPEPPQINAVDLDQWVCLVNLLLTAEGGWRASFRKNHLQIDVSPVEQQQLQYLVAAFRDREQDHPTLRQVLDDLRTLPSAPYPEPHWQTVKSLCRVLRQALIELQLLFAERRTCDFTEIALRARALLRADTTDPLQNSLSRLKHLLVDEMQDTSAGQYELIHALTHTWDGVTQTLFLVGDPKQSIYEFRQARVERFLRVMRTGRLGHLSLGALRLTANFRSQATLVENFNQTFSQILPTPENLAVSPESGDVPFVAAIPTRPAAVINTPSLRWHFAEDTGPATPVDQARVLRTLVEDYLTQAEAEAQAQPEAKAKPEREAPPRPHLAPRMAVLARNRAHLAPIIQEFRLDRGRGPIPFRAVEVEALTERPEILDLLALARALLHPADRAAWLALLRSPVCGLSLPDLLALTGEGPEAAPEATVLHLIATRAHRLSPNGQLLLQRAHAVLLEAQNNLGRTAFATHVERTWRSLGGDAPLQPHARSNASRFLDLLHELEAAPDPLTLPLLNRRLRTLFAEPDTPDAPVELMTIHKAKGLEWDLVLIPALHRGSGRNPQEFLKWLEFDSPDSLNPESSNNCVHSLPPANDAADFLLAPIQSKGDDPSALSSWLSQRQTQRASAEAKRLLYVACTRAREELHLFAAVSRKTDGGSFNLPKPDSLLCAAWPAAESIANQQLGTANRSAQIIAFTPWAPLDPLSERLSLAAAADPAPIPPPPPQSPTPIHRLPLTYKPLARFSPKNGTLLTYTPAETLASQPAFTRPDGSFGARAFGNAVHRFLALLAARLAADQPIVALRAELPSWKPRLLTALRSEGLTPSQADTQASQAFTVLSNTLHDPIGAWLLSPQLDARSEASLPSPSSEAARPLRADRTFLAGPDPLSHAAPTHLWIVDFKTAEPGGRSPQNFLAEQKSKYMAQMQTYATAAATVAGQDPSTMILALYFPRLPALTYWCTK